MKKRTFVKLFSVLLAALMVLGAMPLISAESMPEKTEGYNRYYFYMPEDWKNDYTDTAGIYWWEGEGECPQWPGYKAKEADAEGVYYYDVHKSVPFVIWDNCFDGSAAGSEAYKYVHQTEVVNTDCYDADNSDVYVDGLNSFDNMIYVLDYTRTDTNDYSGSKTYKGEWFYYYGDGKYGTAKEEADAPQIYTSETIVLDDVPPVEKVNTEDGPTKVANRYYFYMPEEWTSENPYTETPGIWWMNGTDSPHWPGNKLVATETEGVYYYDVPLDVEEIIWNNFIDRGIDEEAEIYSADYRTRDVRCDYYEPGENAIYLNCVESFDNMIYVLDLTRTYYDDYQRMTYFEGEWFYYYGNGEYGTAPEKEDALIVYNEDNTELTMVPPQGETIPEGTLTVNCGGKSYEFEYGDTFYYTARLESNKGIENMGAHTNYNSDMLRFVELDTNTMYPHISGVIHNAIEQNGAVCFNYMFYNNYYKFSDEKTLATYKFEVRGVGECDIEMLFTQLSDFYNKDFVDDSGKITEEGIELTEYITEEPYVGKTTIECGGKTYTFNVGETFTYTAILSSEEPVTDFFGRITVGGSKILETPEEERYPNIYYDKGDPEIYFTGQPRGGCDFTTPAVFIQYELQATVECKTIIETIFVELNGYVTDKEGNLPWDYTLTEILTPYGEELPEISLPSTDDEEPATDDEFESGDVNKDGKLNIKDVTAIKKFLAKIIDFDEKVKLLADFNSDGNVNIKDATTIQKKLANLI